jgi:hypothetical protein
VTDNYCCHMFIVCLTYTHFKLHITNFNCERTTTGHLEMETLILTVKKQLVDTIPYPWIFDGWEYDNKGMYTLNIKYNASPEGIDATESIPVTLDEPLSAQWHVRMHYTDKEVTSAHGKRDRKKVNDWVKDPFSLPIEIHENGLFVKESRYAINLRSVAGVRDNGDNTIIIHTCDGTVLFIPLVNEKICKRVFKKLKRMLIVGGTPIIDVTYDGRLGD